MLISFLRYLNLRLDFFGHVGRRLDKQVKTNFKIYDIINWEAYNHKHILPNIPRSKNNQEMKFGQLIEYDVTNIFLPKSCRKWGMETSSRRIFIL